MDIDNHDEDDHTGEEYYRLGNGASIFFDSTKNQKVLTGQVVKLELTELVNKALLGGHLVKATAKQFETYEKKATAALEKAKATDPKAAATATAATALLDDAKKLGEAHLEDAKAQAQVILDKANADALAITDAAKAAAAKPKGGAAN